MFSRQNTLGCAKLISSDSILFDLKPLLGRFHNFPKSEDLKDKFSLYIHVNPEELEYYRLITVLKLAFLGFNQIFHFDDYFSDICLNPCDRIGPGKSPKISVRKNGLRSHERV